MFFCNYVGLKFRIKKVYSYQKNAVDESAQNLGSMVAVAVSLVGAPLGDDTGDLKVKKIHFVIDNKNAVANFNHALLIFHFRSEHGKVTPVSSDL